MFFFEFLTMLGGLALFLYGMKIMGESLAKLAGGKLEQVLEHMTNNPIKGVLLGIGVTAVIQSSSATTVMVVGFVNSGIMKLSQAVGVIMGSNIGTTVTSWLLSLTGIEGDNFFLNLLKPSSFSPVLAIIGVVMLMEKSDKRRDLGTILLGFAILMFGMETMSDAVKPLADVPEFGAFLTKFENPILGLVAGAILTAIIQSSSASVGILQAMCATGSITVGAALPIILGQNIGTCVTALLSGLGANKNAKRAALVHLYFNIIGAITFLIIFYGLNFFLHFGFLSEIANGASIAVIHSAFNITATLVLLPASKLIEKLAYLTIPETEDENAATEVKLLDERFLESPAFAVAQCKNAVCDMAKLTEEAMTLCAMGTEVFDEHAMERVVAIEDIIDKKEDELSSYLSILTTKPLSEKDSRLVGKLSKCITDFERISDYEKGISYAFRKMNKTEEGFSKKALSELQVIFQATMEIVENTVQCFIHEDRDVAMRIDPLADVISELKKEIRKNHNKRLVKGKCSVELGMLLIDMVTSVERIAKHCSNIAEEQLAVTTEEHALHQYARTMKNENGLYQDSLIAYKERYSLKRTWTADRGNI